MAELHRRDWLASMGLGMATTALGNAPIIDGISLKVGGSIRATMQSGFRLLLEYWEDALLTENFSKDPTQTAEIAEETFEGAWQYPELRPNIYKILRSIDAIPPLPEGKSLEQIHWAEVKYQLAHEWISQLPNSRSDSERNEQNRRSAIAHLLAAIRGPAEMLLSQIATMNASSSHPMRQKLPPAPLDRPADQ